MFLSEKREIDEETGLPKVKGRFVYDGSQTRPWIDKDDTASPTPYQESIMLTGVIDAVERRNTLIADIPNAFIQAEVPGADKPGERIIMKITGILVELLCKYAPEVYAPFVVIENGKRVIYVQVLKAIYGMLISALLWYRMFKQDLESIGFEFNPYDMCVANRMIEGSQQTVRFHVDDLWSSHLKKSVNDKFLMWLNDKYGEHGAVSAEQSNKFDYLGVNDDLSEPGVLKLDMID